MPNRTVWQLLFAAALVSGGCSGSQLASRSPSPFGAARLGPVVAMVPPSPSTAHAARDSITVLDFGAPWCMPCRSMSVTTWADARVNSWISANGERRHVDIDENGAMALQYDIGAVPTTVVLRNGREIGRVVGYKSADNMLAWLRSL